MFNQFLQGGKKFLGDFALPVPPWLRACFEHDIDWADKKIKQRPMRKN